MADYYESFSFMVPVDDPAGTLTELEPLVDLDQLENGTPEDHPVFAGVDAFGLPHMEAQEDGIWITDDAGGDIDVAAAIVRWLLERPGAPESVTFTWASSCSKPRLDAFSGGLVKVTQAGYRGITADDPAIEAILDQRLAADQWLDAELGRTS